MSEPRYVLSADGFDVYDSHYCYSEVYRAPRAANHVGQMCVTGSTPLQHAITYRELEKLNAAHDAWLGEDVQAREGTGS